MMLCALLKIRPSKQHSCWVIIIGIFTIIIVVVAVLLLVVCFFQTFIICWRNAAVLLLPFSANRAATTAARRGWSAAAAAAPAAARQQRPRRGLPRPHHAAHVLEALRVRAALAVHHLPHRPEAPAGAGALTAAEAGEKQAPGGQVLPQLVPRQHLPPRAQHADVRVEDLGEGAPVRVDVDGEGQVVDVGGNLVQVDEDGLVVAAALACQVVPPMLHALKGLLPKEDRPLLAAAKVPPEHEAARVQVEVLPPGGPPQAQPHRPAASAAGTAAESPFCMLNVRSVLSTRSPTASASSTGSTAARTASAPRAAGAAAGGRRGERVRVDDAEHEGGVAALAADGHLCEHGRVGRRGAHLQVGRFHRLKRAAGVGRHDDGNGFDKLGQAVEIHLYDFVVFAHTIPVVPGMRDAAVASRQLVVVGRIHDFPRRVEHDSLSV
eukprot:CAMPEP_0194559348 /NCGR_PEP_ID=MMETSP0292-20121207/927_1 /TAXON_ID=39354 /ORGANISM="Heterosigma akashiwo, Strain CCMP2393" /LENGTH=435 /DNA_ID=CAMNT_0039407235 /DNA_START=140 /DNA_END=1448 /DNA_ORIENTATION=-